MMVVVFTKKNMYLRTYIRRCTFIILVHTHSYSLTRTRIYVSKVGTFYEYADV